MILTDAEIAELTRRERRPAQRRVLDALGIPYRIRPDGTLVVFKAYFNAPPQDRQTSPRLRLS
jgi:hypothetical protein